MYRTDSWDGRGVVAKNVKSYHSDNIVITQDVRPHLISVITENH